jgi:ASC-1-like (ASCH) protein
MGIINSCNSNERQYIDQINNRRATIGHSTLNNKSVKPIKEGLIITLSSSFPMELHDTIEYKTLKTLLIESPNNEIISTFSFIQWERGFIDMIKNEENPLLLMEIESSRFSDHLLSKIKKNLFWKIVKTYDKCITNEYGGEIRRVFSFTYKSAHKKVSPIFVKF